MNDQFRFENLMASIVDLLSKGQDEFMGRCVVTPLVKMNGQEPPAPRLLWYDITRVGEEAGEILAAFELFLVCEPQCTILNNVAKFIVYCCMFLLNIILNLLQIIKKLLSDSQYNSLLAVYSLAYCESSCSSHVRLFDWCVEDRGFDSRWRLSTEYTEYSLTSVLFY